VFDAARAGMEQRRLKKGRTSERQVNVFSGIAWNARQAGDSYIMVAKTSASTGASGVKRY
jgi:hypothetical protein